ncbi:UNKNOWN [Stylonychia lemnae]|uniref:Cadherin domain-containing protein n=1 Tax=Stylonychia lemnae TaxID=5949 RepID=A0A078A4V2_STYLE|nr:UNKNOWN [Stylonychia lemnae]|eukprot:CDW76869.1 UNKNOWN [Stylonychia lemnae]
MIYVIGQEPIEQKIERHIYTPENCNKIRYHMEIQGGFHIPNCIYLDQQSLSIRIHCLNQILGGQELNMKVQAIISDRNKSIEANPLMYFQIILISDKFIKNTTAPMFAEPIKDQILIEGEIFTLFFPDILDIDQSGYEIEYKLGVCQLFTKVIRNSLEFEPELGYTGTFEITVILKDKQNSNAINKYTFKVNVLPNQDLNETEIERIQSIKQNAKGYLKAKIKRVTNIGQVYIVFN